MLKDSERVVFKIKSGYSLNGLVDFNLEDKYLQFTNLGNIYVSKVDSLQGENEDYIYYDLSTEGQKLYTEIDGDSVSVIADSIPFMRVKDGESYRVYPSLIMVLDLFELVKIGQNSKKFIFDIQGGNLIMNADGDLYTGILEYEDSRLVFVSSGKRFEFSLYDLESYTNTDNMLNIKGYFYIDFQSRVYRDISFMGRINKASIPKNIDEIVKNNSKIGRLPAQDPIVFCKLSGRLRSNEYLNKNMFLIRHEDLYVLYEKKNKKELVCKERSLFTSYYIGDDNYIVYDGQDVFTLYIDSDSAKKVGFDSLKAIENKSIGFSKEFRPFFIEIDDDYISIMKAEDKCILDIEKSSISNISVNEDLFESEGFVGVEIKFKDKLVIMNLNREIITDLSANIFSEYQKSLLETTNLDEVYDNWIKSVSDMVIFNFFGHIYHMNSKYSYMMNNNIDLADKVDFINYLYSDLQDQLSNIDLITVHMSDILERSEERYFKSLDLTCDLTDISRLQRHFFDLRNDIKMDINGIIGLIDKMSYMILPDEMRKSSIRMLREAQIYQIDLHADMAYQKLEHIIYNLLPHYVAKTVKTVFETYYSFYPNYRQLDEENLKIELMERIKSTHIFRQFNINKESKVLRKDIIEDLYSLMKFGSMKIDSEYYFTGGYR